MYLEALPGVFENSAALVLACAIVWPQVEDEIRKDAILIELEQLDTLLPRTTEDALIACSLAGISLLPQATLDKLNHKRDLRRQYTGEGFIPLRLGSANYCAPDCPELTSYILVNAEDIEAFGLQPCANCSRQCFAQ